MNADILMIGDTVLRSPVGPGAITGFTERGFPQVNRIAAAWLVRTDGVTFDPWRHLDDQDGPARAAAVATR